MRKRQNITNKPSLLFTFKADSTMPYEKINIRMFEEYNDKGRHYYILYNKDGYDPINNMKIILSFNKSKEILNLLNSINLNIFPEHIYGLDGCFYQLEISRGYNKLKLNWWSSVPEKWKKLDLLVNLLLDSCVEN